MDYNHCNALLITFTYNPLKVVGAYQVDRSPCGSGVTARVALQFHKGFLDMGQTLLFESAKTGDIFSGKAVEETKLGDFRAVKVEVGGKGWYTGSATFTLEEEDKLGKGFLL